MEPDIAKEIEISSKKTKQNSLSGFPERAPAPARTPARARKDHQHLVTTSVRPSVCGGCGVDVLSGWSEGLMTHVDVWPVDRDSEIVALMTGRWSYLMSDRRLWRREGTTRTGRVHVQHRCGAVLGTRPLTSEPVGEDHPPF